jgi:hypothetical protein
MLEKNLEQQTPPQPEDVCYYKSFKQSHPDPEYGERCPACNGYPSEGCYRYVTKKHIDDFYKKYGLVNIDEPIKKK